MEVYLYAKTTTVFGDKIGIETTEEMLNTIASQSRTEDPLSKKPRDGLFKDTILWGHKSIQEFVDYVFWIKGVSRTLLQQLARHRMASYNVKSGRHCPPNKVTMPEGIGQASCKIDLKDPISILWEVDEEGNLDITELGGLNDYPLENIRMFYPDAVQVNLFMKMNGSSLRNFLKLRMSSHAQWEIRELANKVYDIVKKDCPIMVWRLNPIKDLKNKLNELLSQLNKEDNADNSGFWVLEELKKTLYSE